jgi:hypothetical protein
MAATAAERRASGEERPNPEDQEAAEREYCQQNGEQRAQDKSPLFRLPLALRAIAIHYCKWNEHFASQRHGSIVPGEGRLRADGLA